MNQQLRPTRANRKHMADKTVAVLVAAGYGLDIDLDSSFEIELVARAVAADDRNAMPSVVAEVQKRINEYRARQKSLA